MWKEKLNKLLDIIVHGEFHGDKFIPVEDILTKVKSHNKFGGFLEGNKVIIDIRDIKSIAYSGWLRLGNKGNGWHTAELTKNENGYEFKITHSLLEDVKAVIFFNLVGVGILYFIDVFKGDLPNILLALFTTLIGISLFFSCLLTIFYFIHKRKIIKFLNNLVR